MTDAKLACVTTPLELPLERTPPDTVRKKEP